MVKGNFIEVVNSLEAINSRCFKLSEMGIDIADSDIVSNAECIAMAIFKENYTDEGIDWIMWWVYEKAGDPDIKAYDEEGKEIISTLDDFGEALSMMRAGMTVINLSKRRYRMKEGNIICLPISGSNQYYVVTKWFPDAVLSQDWSLAED